MSGRKGRFGTVQTFTIPRTTRYLIKAWGARGETDWLTCQLINLLLFNILMSIYIFHCFFFVIYSRRSSFFLFLLLAGFGAGGRRGRFGSIQTFNVFLSFIVDDASANQLQLQSDKLRRLLRLPRKWHTLVSPPLLE